MVHVSVSDDNGRSASFSVDMGDATVADVALQRKVRALKHPKPGMIFTYRKVDLEWFAPERDGQAYVYVVDYVTDGRVFGRVLSLVSIKYEGRKRIYNQKAPFSGGRSILDFTNDGDEDYTDCEFSLNCLVIMYYPDE